MRKIHNLIQGTPEWHAYRAKHFNASDAPAMMGASSYKTRDQLLNEWATGVTEEVDANTQRLFDAGHQFEAAARVIAEKIIGEDLFPATVSLDVEGLPLSASLDGMTMDESIIFEHKTMNKSLSEDLEIGHIPFMYRIQMEQQLMVSGAEKCLFMASKGTEETAKHLWYFPDEKLRADIIAGWVQFERDLDLHKATLGVRAYHDAKPIAEPVITLPGITYNTTFNGKQIELKSNLDVYKAAAEKLVEQSKKKLETDQDFANAEARIKACKAAEEKIAVIQESVVAEVGSIDNFVKDLGEISEMLRQCRINEDKQVKARKEQIKAELIRDYQTELVEYISKLNDRFVSFTKIHLPGLIGFNANFSGVLRNLKTVDSMRSNLNDEMARAKIEVNQTAALIEMNLNTFQFLASEKEFLFADLKQIVVKDPEHFELIVKDRLKDHETAERERIQAEAKKIADEQLAKERAQAEAPAQIELGNETLNQQFNEIFADHKPAPKKIVHNQFQAGVVYGLELALSIYTNRGPKAFLQSVEHFITSYCIPEAPQGVKVPS